MASPRPPQLWVHLSEPLGPRGHGLRRQNSAQRSATPNSETHHRTSKARARRSSASAGRAQSSGGTAPAQTCPQQRPWPLLPDSTNVAKSEDSLWGPVLGKLSSLASGGTS